MKKHEIIDYAHKNYPKGTKFKGVDSDTEFVSNGSFVFGVDAVNYVSSGHNPNSLLNDPVGLVYDADTGTWAKVITEEKPKELEVGKWYNYNKWLVCYTGTNNGVINGYGFSDVGNWHSNANLGDTPHLWHLATEEEIFEALKKEALKRYLMGM